MPDIAALWNELPDILKYCVQNFAAVGGTYIALRAHFMSKNKELREERRADALAAEKRREDFQARIIDALSKAESDNDKLRDRLSKAFEETADLTVRLSKATAEYERVSSHLRRQEEVIEFLQAKLKSVLPEPQKFLTQPN